MKMNKCKICDDDTFTHNDKCEECLADIAFWKNVVIENDKKREIKIKSEFYEVWKSKNFSKKDLKNIPLDIKINAQQKVHIETRAGRIKKKVCKICGIKNTVAHHEDYFKPLKLVWLCQKHHIKRHKDINEQFKHTEKYDYKNFTK
jgi:hypothetical protein